MTNLVRNISFKNFIIMNSIRNLGKAGKIMKMGNTFACFMRIFYFILTSSSMFGKQKYFFYLEFYFTVKTKLLKNYVIFLLINSQLFLLKFDMSIWQLFDTMFLKNEGKDNELFFPTTMYPLLKFCF
jgi:hypothetical protein